MKNVTIALLLTASCFAQTSQPKPAAPTSPQCATVIKCRAVIKAQENEKALALEQMETTKVVIDDLQKRNAELKKKYDDSVAVLDVLATQIKGQHLNLEQQKALAGVEAGKALELGTSLEKDIDVIFKYAVKLQDDNTALTNKYNYLLADAKEQMQRANAEMASMNAQYAKQQRFANALALYNAMPKYQPPQTINLNITDCSRFPAMCLHY